MKTAREVTDEIMAWVARGGGIRGTVNAILNDWEAEFRTASPALQPVAPATKPHEQEYVHVGYRPCDGCVDVDGHPTGTQKPGGSHLVTCLKCSGRREIPNYRKVHPHLINGEFQSDKYPTCPRGKVPLAVSDKTAQDLLYEYAQRRRSVDAEFSADLETALFNAGYAHPPRPTAPQLSVPAEPRETPQEKYSRLYSQASQAMAEHYEQARQGNPCSCVGAGGRREMCGEGQRIYATVVNPLLLDLSPAAPSTGTGGR